ncbi:protein kinase C zeta type-like [Gordionus sp. m RMFG-2023]
MGMTTNTSCGTPLYVAPEILRGDDYSFGVDWWSLGITMYEMLTGLTPFDGMKDNREELFKAILEDPISIPEHVSVNATSILTGFLNKDPRERLGWHPSNGFYQILFHKYFQTVEWNLVII